MSKKKLYSSDSCEYCHMARRRLEKKIQNGEVEIIDVDKDPKAREFVVKHFEGVPTLLTEEANGSICEVDIETGRKLKCVPKR